MFYFSDDNLEDVISKFFEFVGIIKDQYKVPDNELFLKSVEEIESSRDEIIVTLKNADRLKLKNVGLAGNQLEWKYSRFIAAWTEWDNSNTLPSCKKLLRWFNTILGSLSSVLPILEPLKEFKEGIENEIDVIIPN